MARNGSEMGNIALGQFDRTNRMYDGPSRDNKPQPLRKQLLAAMEMENDPRLRFQRMEFSQYNSKLQQYLRESRYPTNVLNNFFSPRNTEEIQKFHREGQSFEDVKRYLDLNSSKYYAMNGQTTNYNKKTAPVRHIVIVNKYSTK